MTGYLDTESWYHIQSQVAGHPLGDGAGVVCSDCGREIPEGDRAKAYIVGTPTGSDQPDQWQISRICHPDCSNIFVEDRMGDSDEQEGIVYGTVQFAPAIARQAEEDRALAEAEWKAIFGDDASVISGPTPRHHLTELELGAVHCVGSGTFNEVSEA